VLVVMSSNRTPAQIATRIRALAEKRFAQARSASTPALREELKRVAAQYQVLAHEMARQEEVRARSGLESTGAAARPRD
jgi:hypothetical protein